MNNYEQLIIAENTLEVKGSTDPVNPEFFNSYNNLINCELTSCVFQSEHSGTTHNYKIHIRS